MQEIDFIHKKLYESLAIPKGFLESGQTYSSAAVAFQSMAKSMKDMGVNISDQLFKLNLDREEERILNKSW